MTVPLDAVPVSVVPLPDRPSALLQVMTAVWACLAGAMSAQVVPWLLLLGIVSLFGLFLGLRWIVQFAVWLSREDRQRLGWRGRFAWAFCPAVGVLMTGMYFTQIPLVVRVKLSEPALLKLARVAEPEELRASRRAGLMFVQGVVVQGGVVFYSTEQGFLFGTTGLAYLRDGVEPREDWQGTPTSYRHLFGRWWIFNAGAD